MTVSKPVSSSLVHSSVSRPSAQAHTTFCKPPLHAHSAMAMNQKVLITSVTPGISTSQLPSLTRVLGESHLSSFVLERWAQRHIQKRYAVAPVCPPEDDLKEQEWLLGLQALSGWAQASVANFDAVHSQLALCQFPALCSIREEKNSRGGNKVTLSLSFRNPCLWRGFCFGEWIRCRGVPLFVGALALGAGRETSKSPFST